MNKEYDEGSGTYQKQPAKDYKCPNCKSNNIHEWLYNFKALSTCYECGFEFTPPNIEKLQDKNTTLNIKQSFL